MQQHTETNPENKKRVLLQKKILDFSLIDENMEMKGFIGSKLFYLCVLHINKIILYTLTNNTKPNTVLSKGFQLLYTIH